MGDKSNYIKMIQGHVAMINSVRRNVRNLASIRVAITLIEEILIRAEDVVDPPDGVG